MTDASITPLCGCILVYHSSCFSQTFHHLLYELNLASHESLLIPEVYIHDVPNGENVEQTTSKLFIEMKLRSILLILDAHRCQQRRSIEQTITELCSRWHGYAYVCMIMLMCNDSTFLSHTDLLTLLQQHRLRRVRVDSPGLNEFEWVRNEKENTTRKQTTRVVPNITKQRYQRVTQAVPGTGFLSHKWPNTSTRHASGWIPITNGTAHEKTKINWKAERKMRAIGAVGHESRCTNRQTQYMIELAPEVAISRGPSKYCTKYYRNVRT